MAQADKYLKTLWMVQMVLGKYPQLLMQSSKRVAETDAEFIPKKR